jgi:hypothetical protein
MNTSPASVLPLTAIALCLTPRRIYELLGFERSLEILEAVRLQKNQRECARLNAELKEHDAFH